MPKFSDAQLESEIEQARDRLPALTYYGKVELAKRQGQRRHGRPRKEDTEQRRKWRAAKQAQVKDALVPIDET